MLSVEPLIPNVLWVTLAAAGAIVLGWYALGRPVTIRPSRWAAIIVAMAVALVLVLGVLLNPTFVRPVPPPPGKPLLTVLVDESASMGTPDGAGGRSRFAEAAEIARQTQQAAGEKVEVQVRTFSGTVSANAGSLEKIKPEGRTTDVAGAINSVIEPDRTQGQGIVVLTDGIQTADGGAAAVRDAALAAKAAGTPLYVRTIGGQGAGRDVQIEPRNPQELAFLKQKVALHAAVRSRGYTGDAAVQLLRDGKAIDSRKVPLKAGEATLVSFDVSQEVVGVYPYEMRVDALEGELTAANNAATVVLRTVDRPVRVLLIEGKPYWDSKFLTRMLALDPSIELHAQVKVAPGRIIHRVLSRSGGAATTPSGVQEVQESWKVVKDATETLANPAALSTYQIVLLGRDAQEFLSEAAISNLQRWISREGGSLVCYGGAPMAQMDPTLARLMPVRWTPVRESRFRLKLTEAGKDLNFFAGDAGSLGGLPSLASATTVHQTKPLTVILATASRTIGEDTPAITFQPYGAGRTVVIEGAGMWRWAFMPRAQQTDDTYATLWHGLFRWLVSNTGLPPGVQATLRADKISFSTGENATATVLTRVDAGNTQPAAVPTIELTSAAGTTRFSCTPFGDDPGAYRVNFGNKLPEGRYEGRILGGESEAARTVFDVRQVGEEELNLTARPDLLQAVADLSGGSVLGENAANDVAQTFAEHLRSARPARVIRTSAWDRWWVLGAVLVLWTACWALRRSSGLV